MHRGLSRLAIVFVAIFVLAFAMAINFRRNTSLGVPGSDDTAADEDREKPGDAPALRPGIPPESGGAADGRSARRAPDEGTGDPLASRLRAGENPWASVDLEAVRAALPDNTFWRMGAPTKDPEVLRAREEERARWNEEYGKVLSSTATDDEILAYYRERERVSSDYVKFATYLLENYGAKLSQQDVGLLKLAVQMHLARLEEMPRQIAEATERAHAHEVARQAWLADEAAFAAGEPRSKD